MLTESVVASDVYEGDVAASKSVGTGSPAARVEEATALDAEEIGESTAVGRTPARLAASSFEEVAEKQAWQEFWSTGSVEDRNRLVEIYLHLVDAAVRRMPHEILRYWGADDLRGFGVFGLIDAIGRRRRGHTEVSFEAYAGSRIRGAIYDELRALDWLPRSARRKAVEFKRTEDDLRSSLRRNPAFGEVLAELRTTTPAQVTATARALSCSQITSLEGRFGQDSGGSKAESLAASDDLELDLVAQVDQQELQSALAGLSTRERAILGYRYRDRLTLQEVGDLVGVSSSRVCQIEHATLRELRRVLETAAAA